MGVNFDLNSVNSVLGYDYVFYLFSLLGSCTYDFQRVPLMSERKTQVYIIALN